ncbi:hypothetical protein [Streptomyces sp. NRRL F-5135]|uniref:hypothetical protein n=1 Tax=Streptomyces sp. NRRL F-5135 TaxID=1463858 RepID=UPI0004C9DF31|nr:hypothetical protein [Streptomyces sp. NRRL F-5135]
MNHDLTHPAPPRPFSALRDALMHALAVAEEAVSHLQVAMPDTVTLTEHAGTYSVSLCFHPMPERVAEFAAAYDGVPVVRVPNQRRDGWSFTEATAVVRGVQVRAWALTEDEAKGPADGETAVAR